MGGVASENVANSLPSFAFTLPSLGEEAAADGETMVCQLALEIIQQAIHRPASAELSREIGVALGGV
jgi:hypothetical protein